MHVWKTNPWFVHTISTHLFYVLMMEGDVHNQECATRTWSQEKIQYLICSYHFGIRSMFLWWREMSITKTCYYSHMPFNSSSKWEQHRILFRHIRCAPRTWRQQKDTECHVQKVSVLAVHSIRTDNKFPISRTLFNFGALYIYVQHLYTFSCPVMLIVAHLKSILLVWRINICVSNYES